MYRTIEATLDYADKIAQAQAEAFKRVIHLHPMAVDETVKDIEARINDPLTRLFIMLNEEDKIVAGITYRSNVKGDCGYGFRWFSLEKGAGVQLRTEVQVKLKESGVQRVFGRTFTMGNHLAFSLASGYRIASEDEISECLEIIGDAVKNTEWRTYIVKDL